MPKFHSLELSYKNFARYERGHRPATIKQTIDLVRKLLQRAGNENVCDINTAIVRDFLQCGRMERDWSAKTFQLYRQYLKTFFEWAKEEGFVDENPVTPIKQPRLPKRLPRCLTPDEARKVLFAARSFNWHLELQRSRNEAICYTLTYAGLRLSEFMNLETVDVDLFERTIRVRDGKNAKERFIPISEDLYPVLKRYSDDRKRLGPSSKWFFGSIRSNKRLTKKNAEDIIRRISARAKVKFTAHMLRHTFGKICVDSGIDIRTIQVWMGHEDIRTTQIYTFVSLETSKQAMTKLQL